VILETVAHSIFDYFYVVGDYAKHLIVGGPTCRLVNIFGSVDYTGELTNIMILVAWNVRHSDFSYRSPRR